MKRLSLIVFVILVSFSYANFDSYIDEDILKFSLKQYEVESYPVVISNTGSTNSNFKIYFEGLKNIVAEENNLMIDAKNSKEIEVVVFTLRNEEADVYFGKMIIDSNGPVKTVDVVKEISSANSQFDVKVELGRIKKGLLPLSVYFNKNPDFEVENDLIVEIYAKDFEGNTLAFKEVKLDKGSDYFNVNEKLEVEGNKFLVYVKLRHNGDVSVGSEVYIERGNDCLFFGIIFLLFFGTLFGVFFTIVRRKTKLKKSKVQKTYNEDSLFLLKERLDNLDESKIRKKKKKWMIKRKRKTKIKGPKRKKSKKKRGKRKKR